MQHYSLDCPICQSFSRRLFQKEAFWIWRCRSCGHQFLDLETTAHHAAIVYGDDYFNGGGAGYPGYLGEADLICAHGRRYGQILNRYMKPGRMLDVGAAAGFVLQGLMQSGWQGAGIEPNHSMATYGRDCLKLDVRTGSFEQFQAQEQYDLVTMIQVIPHFWDLSQALKSAEKLTVPGGYWLIETWNRDSKLAKLFGESWHEYSPPSVLRWFAPEDLGLLAEQYGFEEVDRGRPQKWISGAHVKSLVGHKLSSMGVLRYARPLLRLIPDRLRLPYPSEDLFWVLYRKVDGTTSRP
jgi:SAM-dependent methyltransferase